MRCHGAVSLSLTPSPTHPTHPPNISPAFLSRRCCVGEQCARKYVHASIVWLRKRQQQQQQPANRCGVISVGCGKMPGVFHARRQIPRVRVFAWHLGDGGDGEARKFRMSACAQNSACVWCSCCVWMRWMRWQRRGCDRVAPLSCEHPNILHTNTHEHSVRFPPFMRSPYRPKTRPHFRRDGPCYGP